MQQLHLRPWRSRRITQTSPSFYRRVRTGGAGTIAAVMTAKALPDDYTLLMSTISALATNVSVHADLQYDPLRNSAPVAMALATP